MHGTLSSVPQILTPYIPPVQSGLFLMLWIALSVIGVVTMGYFFVYEVNVSKRQRSIGTELGLATVSSTFIAFAVIFLMMWAGVWV